MEKIIGVLQRLLKNILNNNMDKSEKSFYVIIKNKKCGKFSGEGPIQVAKKVASKKLKSGKEMEFYLDEVGGKKKRYGSYQARKDKKTGKIVVVKARKVMKGGVLSEPFRNRLKQNFIDLNSKLQKSPESFFYTEEETFRGDSSYVQLHTREDFTHKLSYWVLHHISDIDHDSIIYFCPFDKMYRLAIFVDDYGISYIIIYENYIKIDIVNMTEFFLNPFYSYIFTKFEIIKYRTLLWLRGITKDISNSQIISQEAKKIIDLLYVQTGNRATQKAMIYVPDDSEPLIKKCVYSNLTFGIFDERTHRFGNTITEIPTSFYQSFLIKKKQKSLLELFSKSKFFIYIQLPVPNIEVLEQQLINNSGSSSLKPSFSFCIYTDPSDSNKLKINDQSLTVDFNKTLTSSSKIIIACYILLTIPEEFEKIINVREIARHIIGN